MIATDAESIGGAVRIVAATPNLQFESYLRTVLGDQAAVERIWAATYEGDWVGQLIGRLTASAAEVVVLGPDVDHQSLMRMAREVDAARSDIALVLFAKPSMELLSEALSAGVRNVITESDPGDVIRAKLEEVAAVARRRRSMALAAESGPSRRVVVVLGPKGGSGKTTVSTNLAVTLAEGSRDDTVLVDLDLQFGDVGSALRILSDHTIAAVAGGIAPHDSTAVKLLLARYEGSLYVLCAPESPAEADAITQAHVASVVQTLSGEFRYVVVDTGSGLDEATLAVLPLATDFVIVAGTDVPSTRGAAKSVRTLDMLGFTAARRHLVVNRADAKTGLAITDLEAAIGLPAAARIPVSAEVTRGVNEGVPLVHVPGKLAAADALRQLAYVVAPDLMLGAQRPAKRRRGL